MGTDVEVERTLNALSVTLNDQRPGLDPERLQEIVDGTTAGERVLTVRTTTAPDRAQLLDAGSQATVAELTVRDGEWTVRRADAPPGESYVPDPSG
jgi:hypothetical protein